MSASTRSVPPGKPVSDDEVRALLDRYQCPVPFHVVRTRFLGSISSPIMAVSPIDAVAGLWGGELPVVDSPNAANELLRVLVMGLWNQLARHQQRKAPFRLIGVDTPPTREGLARTALIRREEVIGFIQALFGNEEGLSLPRPACRALEALSEAGGLLGGVYEVASNPMKPASAEDIVQTQSHIRELTKVCEREINEAVLACTGARRQMPNSGPARKPTLH